MSDDHVTPYLARLPIGERVPVAADGIASWDIFPFEGDLRTRVLDAPELPEPPRDGDLGADSCSQCARPDEDFLWTDRHWRLAMPQEAAALPALVLLQPRGHHDFADLPVERSAELGPMLQRVERAVLSLGGIARVHHNKWGDGAAHLHVWLIARPAGMMQLRGSCLPVWNDLLPNVPDEQWQRNRRVIAAAMAADGGTAHV